MAQDITRDVTQDVARERSHATLTDVARSAGVGIGTVSRVVNGGVNVSPDTFKKVEAAILQLGYLPNHAARILKGGRTKTIGLLVPSIADSFFASCAEAAGDVARLHGSLLIVAVSGNQYNAEKNSLDVLMQHRPDGLLIVPTDSESKTLLRFVKNISCPVVTFDRPLLGSDCSGVSTDNCEAAFAATTHLLEHGYRRILCFGSEPRLFTIHERLRGYTQAMQNAGLPSLVDINLNEDGSTAEQLLRGHLENQPPDAIFTLKNSATIATFLALQKLKVSVPAEIALLGFDDFDLAGALQPSVSVVQQPIKDVGQKAAELLFTQLDHKYSADNGKQFAKSVVVLQSRLVLRESCGCKRSLSETLPSHYTQGHLLPL